MMVGGVFRLDFVDLFTVVILRLSRNCSLQITWIILRFWFGVDGCWQHFHWTYFTSINGNYASSSEHTN